MVYVLHFRKSTGHTVWRVLQAFMSSMEWDLVMAMCKTSRGASMQEFEGPDAEDQALACAQRWVRNLPVCEYGITHQPGQPAKTFADLQEDARRAGFGNRGIDQLVEATDDDRLEREIQYWQNF